MSDHVHRREGDPSNESRIIEAIKNGTGTLVTRIMVIVCLPVLTFFCVRLVAQVDDLVRGQAVMREDIAALKTEVGWVKRILPGAVTLEFEP